MDRQIVYPGQILPETTLLQMTKDAMIGLGKLAAATIGTGNAVNGFAVTPTSPASLQVYVAPGEIYSLQNIDSTAFSTLAADTAHQIVKQGISLDQQTLTLTAPVTSGQSINYLIEATYQDSDANPVLLPYYNSANPGLPYSGQGNNGQTQNTARKGAVVLQAKAGTPAATGSQTTPAPDAGYVGLYVVTVAYGQTQITAPNIVQYAPAPFISLVNMGQIQNQTGTAFAAGGTAPAYTLTPSPVISAYAPNLRFRVSFGAAGTTGSNTLNISGLGAKSLMQYDSNGTLVPAVIPAGLLSDVEYNGSVMVLLDPVAGKSSVVGSSRNLKVNISLAATSAAWTADEIIAETSLGGAAYQLANFNKTLNLATAGIGGMDTGTAPVNGYVAIYAAYNPSTGAQGIFACNAATSSGSVYGGANLPAGYTATALISTWPTNASGQLVAGCQVDRQISVPVVNVLTSSSYAASWTSLSIAGAVPPNAKSCCGWLGVGNSTNVGASLLVSPTSTGVGYQLAETPIGSTYSAATPFSSLPILNAQTIYYQTGGSGGTLSISMSITGYSI